MGVYEIQYSPGIIFSNNVPALKVDFIGSIEKTSEVGYSQYNLKEEKQTFELMQNVVKNTENYVGAWYVSNEQVKYTQVYVMGAILYEAGLISRAEAQNHKDWPGYDAGWCDWEDFCDICDDNDITWHDIANGVKGDRAAQMFAIARGGGQDKDVTLNDFFSSTGAKTLDGELVQKDLDAYNIAKKAFLAGFVIEPGSDFGQIDKYNGGQETCWGNVTFGKNEFWEKSWIYSDNVGEIANNFLEQYNLYSDEENGTKFEFTSYVWDGYLWVCLKDSTGDRYGLNFNEIVDCRSDKYKKKDDDGATIIIKFKYDLSDFGEAKSSYYRTNTDFALKPQISKWYNALRTVALVGLLSVLVYIGIRIILSSSSAQDKAKYKNMLKDWLVALCILYILHYVMGFMLQFNQALNDIFAGAVITSTEEGHHTDELMNYVRTQIKEIEEISGGQAAAYALMWLTLVILTLMFTFQYLKRAIYMAFLTMIAPLIALTYPLDKIKDGKAQAFSYWLREYIFQCLIQPVHLLLYSMLIGSAIDFAKENVLYAIVALSFMVPAEKIVKEMFGLKSDQGAGGFSAALGGAAVMNMMNKLKQAKPPKGEGQQGGAKGSGGVRTSNNRTGGTNPTSQGGSSSAGTLESGGTDEGSSSGGGSSTGTTSSGGGPSAGASSKGSVLRGAGRFVKRAVGGPKGIKYRGRKLTGLVGGAVGATIGLAATIAQRRCIKIGRKYSNRISRRKCIRRKSGSNRNGFTREYIK